MKNALGKTEKKKEIHVIDELEHRCIAQTKSRY